MRLAILATFALSYVGITARRLRWLPVGRPSMALIGATVCVALGAWAGPPYLGLDEALRAVELHTLSLLLGMMVVAAGLGEAGFFTWATSVLSTRVRSRAGLLWAVTIGCGLLSAVLVNDAVCLLATPMVVQLAQRAQAPVRPFLFAVAMGSNAGSALTLAGNPQNMLVGRLSGLSYRGYLADVAVPVLAALLVTAALLHLFFRERLAQPEPATVDEDSTPIDRPLLVVSLVGLGGAVAANLLGAPLALSALGAGTLTLIAAGLRAEKLLAQVDWSVLLFFAGLFVLVAALQKTGFPQAWVADTEAVLGHGSLVLTAVLGLGSQVVSNVPLILLLEPWIRSFPDANAAWTVTALVSTLAGNLTLLGSVANIIVLERAKERMGFVEYARVGVPVTLASTLVALLLLRRG
ncbi:MAG: SLC13 family permease [Myxococcaceae bacterium]|nr:SLC13 family permease [Myxococcaceae bacterium]